MERNIFPEIHLFDPVARLKQVAHFAGRLLSLFPEDAPDYMSEHYKPRGAAEMLDSHLDTPNATPVRDFGWTDMGEYIDLREA